MNYLIWTDDSDTPTEMGTRAEALAYAHGVSDGVGLCKGELNVWAVEVDGERERVIWRNSMAWSES